MTDTPSNSLEDTPEERFRRLLAQSEEPSRDGLGEGTEPPEALPQAEAESRAELAGGDGQEEKPDNPSVEFVSLSGQFDPLNTSGADPDELEKTPSDGRRRTMPPPPPLGQTPLPGQPALGTQGMPLPRRVNEIDVDATRVSPIAYPDPPRRPPRATPAGNEIPPAAGLVARLFSSTAAARIRRRPFIRPRLKWRQNLGCLLRMFLLGVFAMALLAVVVGSYLLWHYYNIASSLPDVNDLRQRAAQFETTRILDRNGNILYEILDPNAGRRTYVKLERISPFLIAATIATEDKEFYSHPGVDLFAIMRAFWQNFQGGETVSGASTITQQLARTLLFTAEERSDRSYERKIREAILAAEITRRYTKDQILELYLNEIYFGNLAYGVEAAAETYFGVTVENLTLAQAAFLAGLPQAPSVYDVYTNREATMQRLEQVLRLMLETSQEKGCIYVSNQAERVCVDTDTALAAYYEMYAYEFRTPDVQIRYPHWVNFVRSLLEAQYDPQTIYRSGFTVYTTLDPGLQDAAQQMVLGQVKELAEQNANNGALVAIRPKTGEILAMVGSADFNNEDIDGQVNMAVAPRQPGSAMKPITYLAAFEKGWTPATLLWDVPTEFSPSGRIDDPSPRYVPRNYDERFHGPVTVRSALANSYNIPAVKTLEMVGIYDNPDISGEDGFLALARRLGISTLTSDQYGLSLTLGGGEVSLLEMTNVYATLANLGSRVPPYAIARILDTTGNVVYDYQPSVGAQVLRPEHAFLMNSILSDNEARTPMFGADSVLNLPFPSAAKTGTTNDFRDNLTFGYTPDLAVGVWVGNADYTPMVKTTGLSGAAPIWSEFMKFAIPQITGGNPTPFYRPSGIVDRVICAVSGAEPSQWCPVQRSEVFAAGQPPMPKEYDLWTKVLYDTWTYLRASPACSSFTSEEMALNVTEQWALRWLRDTTEGRAWLREMDFAEPVYLVPARECRADDPRPVIEISAPLDEQTVTTNPVDIHAKVDATANFRSFTLDYGLGAEPVQWFRLLESAQPFPQVEKLYSWDVKDLQAGVVSLHLVMYSTQNTYAEVFWQVNLQVPTPTPTPTETPTPTPTATEPPPPTVTLTPLPTATPVTPSPVPTVTETVPSSGP